MPAFTFYAFIAHILICKKTRRDNQSAAVDLPCCLLVWSVLLIFSVKNEWSIVLDDTWHFFAEWLFKIGYSNYWEMRGLIIIEQWKLQFHNSYVWSESHWFECNKIERYTLLAITHSTSNYGPHTSHAIIKKLSASWHSQLNVEQGHRAQHSLQVFSFSDFTNHHSFFILLNILWLGCCLYKLICHSLIILYCQHLESGKELSNDFVHFSYAHLP